MLNTWLISWRNITRNKKRFFLSLLGIIIGVSFITSMFIADKTTKDVFEYYEQMYVADADYWFLSDEYSFSEDDLLSKIDDSMFSESLLVLDKQAFIEISDKTLSQRSVRITGVDDQNSLLLKLPVISGDLDNEGLVIPHVLANLLNKKVGDTIRFSGLGESKISAIVEYNQLLASPSNWESAESASFRIIAPLSLLREWTGLDGEVSYVRVKAVNNGDKIYQELQQNLINSNIYVQPVVADDRQSNDIDGLYTFFYLIAGLSMLISGFIVFNMIYTSVMERKKEFAIMKSLGYLKSSISKLVLYEVILMSTIGTILGLPLGIFLGDLFMKTLLNVFEFDMVYTLNWKLPIIISAILGIGFPVISSLFPIYNAGKTSVLLTLKRNDETPDLKKQLLLRGISGLGLLVFIFIDHSISYIAILLSLFLLFPFLLIGISKIFKSLFKMFFGYAGVMAIQSLLNQLNRNSNTSAVLGIGIAIILMLSSVIESAPESYAEEIRNTFGGDIRITSEVPWSNSDITTLQKYDSILNVTPLTEATPITWNTIKGELRQFSIFAINKEKPILFTEFNEKYVEKVINSEPSIILGQRAYDEWGGKIGNDMYINTPLGKQKFKVIDVVDTSHYSGYVGFMNQETLNTEFGWKNSFDLLLTLNDESQEKQIANQLFEDFNLHLSKIRTVNNEINSKTAALSGTKNLILVMLVLIIGLASIGTANTLLMNTLERRAEIGTMRAIGFTRQQVNRMIISEGLLIGLSGFIGGAIATITLLYMMSKSTALENFISFQVPIFSLILALISSIVLSVIAAWISSILTSRINIMSSLKEG
ncbi:FtsX-like permease family protein [Savagea sp. SN6]|uniref:FtsX-like permease family protein n=1 Tax=Savagea serpentis TaxID=2785297 RepID=A0A8J7G5U4_9BACL|nr:FtsX-like permease family protein [Savagea serpentis]MBF4501962.1 FtsX-like permease family protein [Savagea serpentis]